MKFKPGDLVRFHWVVGQWYLVVATEHWEDSYLILSVAHSIIRHPGRITNLLPQNVREPLRFSAYNLETVFSAVRAA